MNKIFLILIIICSISLTTAQNYEPNLPTITLNGNENAKALAQERIDAINEILEIEGRETIYGLKWESKKMTSFLTKYETTSEYKLEDDMKFKISVSEYEGIQYSSVSFIYSTKSGQVYNGYLRHTQDEFGQSLNTLRSTQLYYSYVKDIKKLMFSSSLKGLTLTEVKAYDKYEATEENIDRVQLANERIININKLFAHEYEEDRDLFSVTESNWLKFINFNGCEHILQKLIAVSYSYDESDNLAHHVKVVCYTKHSPSCPWKNVNFNIHKFSNKVSAELFQSYILDLKKILYDPTLNVEELDELKPIPNLLKDVRKEPAPISLAAYENHEHLKLLGMSADDPEVLALRAQKNGFYYFKDDEYSSPHNVYYLFDENINVCTKIGFYTAKKDGFVGVKKKMKVYKDELPPQIPGVTREDKDQRYFNRTEYYLSPEVIEQIGKKVTDLTLEKELVAREGQAGHLIYTKEDLKRYADPKGDDIWKLVGNNDELLSKYVYNEHVRRNGSLSKNWNDRMELQLSSGDFNLYNSYEYKYIIRKRAAGSGKQDYLRERLPFDLENVKFDLGTFLPQVFSLDEFVSAHFGEDTEIIFGKTITCKAVEIKFNTNYGDRYVIIKQYPDEVEGYFSKMTFQKTALGGYANSKLEPLTLQNSPWTIHNETIVKVDSESKESYIAGFSKLLDHLEQNFQTLKTDSEVLFEEEGRDIFNLKESVVPNEKISMLIKYQNGNDFVQINVKENVKNEIYNTLLNKKDVGTFTLIPGGIENESLFGKCMLIQKNRKIIGVIQFNRFIGLGGEEWGIRVFPFEEEQFKKDLITVITEGMKDNYQAWRTSSEILSHTLYQANLSFRQEIDEQKLYSSAYVNLPRYVLEKSLENLKKGDELGGGIKIHDSFIDYETYKRYVNLKTSNGDAIIILSNVEGQIMLSIVHGAEEGYSHIVKENFEPLTASKLTEMLVEKYSADWNADVIWSSYDEKEFSTDIGTYRQEDSYTLIIINEEKFGAPSAGIRANLSGDFQTFGAREDNELPLPDGFKGNAISVISSEYIDNLHIFGGYNDSNPKGRVCAVVLKDRRD